MNIPSLYCSKDVVYTYNTQFPNLCKLSFYYLRCAQQRNKRNTTGLNHLWQYMIYLFSKTVLFCLIINCLFLQGCAEILKTSIISDFEKRNLLQIAIQNIKYNTWVKTGLHPFPRQVIAKWVVNWNKWRKWDELI